MFRKILVWVVFGGGVLLMCLVGYGFYLFTALTLPNGEDDPSLLIYGAPFRLEPGLHIGEARLGERLELLGYRQVRRQIRSPGDYHIAAKFIDVYLHNNWERGLRGTPLRLILNGERITQISSLTEGKAVLFAYLERPLVSGILGGSHQVRERIPLDAIPARVVDVFLTVEDRRFHQHMGIDPLAVARAVRANLKQGKIQQGGSTITQQLAKNLYYSADRTMARKLKEAAAAVILELKYEKKEILESYLNEIYLGHAGSLAVYGVGQAARRYVGKPVQGLTIADAALLAGMVKAPNTYSPLKNPQRARQRRDLILHHLRGEGELSEESWRDAVDSPLRIALPRENAPAAPYFVDDVVHELQESCGADVPRGASVLTTIDPVMQWIAEDALASGLERLETAYPFLKQNGRVLQGAVIILDPKTGGILAMVGGRHYQMSQYNRAVQARRQPGSLFKPLVYLAAFESGRESGNGAITPATLVQDAPLTFAMRTGSWSPQNYDRRFRGPVTVRTALEQSLNVPTVRIAQRVGLSRIAGLTRDLGIPDPRQEDLTIALGTSEVSLLQMTGAFGALGQGGLFVAPSAIQAVIAPSGEIRWCGTVERRQAVSPQSAYLVTALLKGVLERGTASAVKAAGLQKSVAGKTGTTDGFRDAWFVGYTPTLAIGVWIGFDDGESLSITGAEAALPIWTDVARKVIPSNSPDFSIPLGVVARAIDPLTGQRATAWCPESITEFFIEGTEPTQFCPIHDPGPLHPLERMFRALREVFGW